MRAEREIGKKRWMYVGLNILAHIAEFLLEVHENER